MKSNLNLTERNAILKQGYTHLLKPDKPTLTKLDKILNIIQEPE